METEINLDFQMSFYEDLSGKNVLTNAIFDITNGNIISLDENHGVKHAYNGF
jgi:hypothetical protein